MTPCEIKGDAAIQRTANGLRWLHADPEIHVTKELLAQADYPGLSFLLQRYTLGEPCPWQPSTIHARRNDLDGKAPSEGKDAP